MKYSRRHNTGGEICLTRKSCLHLRPTYQNVKTVMSVAGKVRAVTTLRLTEMKQRGEKIAMLTSYDYSMAKIVDAAGVDVILVGDSAANVMAGYETTLPITLDMMIYHAR